MAASNLRLVPPGDGKTVTVIGHPITIKIHGHDTGGAFAVVETADPLGGGPPPHIHHREDETFYVLEGEYELMCGGQTHRMGKGATALLPRDVPHAYKCLSAGGGHLLVTLTPAGFERFFEEVGALSAAEQQDIPRVIAIGQKYGLEFLPPA
ncbi:MAG: cupin domain-containing protein [Verrucomicrobia bacterium]|nr:cupin domain-containing protein [Verrucomicrobiota bacterium]